MLRGCYQQPSCIFDVPRHLRTPNLRHDATPEHVTVHVTNLFPGRADFDGAHDQASSGAAAVVVTLIGPLRPGLALFVFRVRVGRAPDCKDDRGQSNRAERVLCIVYREVCQSKQRPSLSRNASEFRKCAYFV